MNPPRPDDSPDREILTKELYRELRRVAAMQMARAGAGQTLQATALVHEAWIKLAGHRQWESGRQFLANAVVTMRRLLIDRARQKARLKRGGMAPHTGLTQVDSEEQPTTDEDLLLVDEVLERYEQVDPEKAKVVLLKFFGGLSNLEVAREMGISERTVDRYWAYARAWMYCEMQQRAQRQ